MALVLFRLEWMRTLRSPRIVGALFAVLLVLGAASWWSASLDRRQVEAQRAASAQARADWLAQGAANPHGMAHFGDFVFRPSGPLARIDGGVQASLGRVLRVEGHAQGIPIHTASANAGSITRFGRFDPAFLLQVVGPLLVLLMGATATASDRASGRFRWALAHGASPRAWVVGRFLALWSVGLLLMATVAVAAIAADPQTIASVAVDRLVGMGAFYALFYGVISATTVGVSYATRSPGMALLVVLLSWVAGTAVLPRVTTTMASQVATLPTRDAFRSAMFEDKGKKIDGHNPLDKRIDEIREQVLAEYSVEKTEDLPINFTGIVMQLDEEYGNPVWDEHYGRLHATFDRQAQVGRIAALVNPYQAIDGLSMSLAGTDLAHDLAFQRAVEDYRRAWVEALNHEHAYGGSKSGDWSWKADAAFLADLGAYEHRVPPLTSVLGGRSIEILALVGWFMVGLALLGLQARRLETQEAA
ncbi:MAG: DUF3526 domain-containing protein [Myxococcota bacterium]